MTEIDFAKIRSTPKSRNDSFEALAVQLFRSHCSVPDGSTFISLRGDGGDGGVEAYFRTPEGTVLGVQAKYFFSLDSSELGQIDGSLKTALNNHPKLSQYWVYIPFDLTGRVAAGKRGQSQAERFEGWKTKVEADAVARGTPLSIKLCAAAVIRSQLLGIDYHGGVRRYWFDESVLTLTHIENCLEQAKAFAGPRYSSALDFVTSAHEGLDFFGGIGDFQAWCTQALSPVLGELRSLKGWGKKALDILQENKASRVHQLIDQVLTVCDDLAGSVGPTANVESAIRLLSELRPLLTEVRDAQEQDFYTKHGKNSDTPGFRQFHAEYMCSFPAGDMDAARKWEASCSRLQEALSSPELGAATTRSLLLVGPAGIGKTHAIVSAALRRVAYGGLSLIVFGDDFGKGEPWEVLRSKLGFGASVGREALFECLQACAEHTGLPFTIYIDALNESPREARWKDKLPELLVQCQPYTSVKVCVSTRDTYRNLVVDKRFPGFAFEHVGFAGQEFEALQAFAAFYDLDSEITPLFAPELSNPLFLHLACRTLKAEGRDSLDVSLAGFTALFESHLKHCDELIRGRLQYVNPRNLVRASMMCLAKTLTLPLPQERTWDACVGKLRSVLGSELTPEVMLKELGHEGLIILTSEDNDTWLVRLGYQRYGDVLRAVSLIEGCTHASEVNVSELAKKLAALLPEDEGLLEALAAVLPEKTGVEITSAELGLEPTRAYRFFISALIWRSRDSVSLEIRKHIYGALHTSGLWQQVYEAFFQLSLLPDHQLNAVNGFHDFLQRQLLVDRDAFLSYAAFKSFDAKGAVRSLINASLRADILRWPAESRKLAAIVLAWLTSCSDRRVRDLAAKGLTRIVACQPVLGRELTDAFEYCDDDYVLESISLAIYCACLLEHDRRAEFVPALEGLLSPTFDVENVLVRDTVRLLGKLLENEGVSDTVRELLANYPGKAVAPAQWPTLVDAEPLLSLEHLSPNMKLWGEPLGPDFWRYQVESKLRNFDLVSASISHENIACWLMVEALRLGYPGTEECALDMDRVISSLFGTGRGREGYADRLGKKYYWISLHRLLGVLADNVPYKESFAGWKPGAGYLWSVNVRKVDLTDVRDISPIRKYPDEISLWPIYKFPDRSSDIKSWVRLEEFPPHEQCIIRMSTSGEPWVALSLNIRDNDRPRGDDSWSDPYLGFDLYYSSIFVEASVSKRLNSSIKEAFESQGASCYRAYLAEYPSAPIFDQLDEEGDFYKGSEGMHFSVITLLRGGEWEYDYSSEGSQERLRVPCQSLIQVLGLSWDQQRGWVDASGAVVAFEAGNDHCNGFFIGRAALNSYLKITGNRLLYRRFANRGLFSQSGSRGAQMDLFTWLQYEQVGKPAVLKEEKRPYNC